MKHYIGHIYEVLPEHRLRYPFPCYRQMEMVCQTHTHGYHSGHLVLEKKNNKRIYVNAVTVMYDQFLIVVVTYENLFGP